MCTYRHKTRICNGSGYLVSTNQENQKDTSMPCAECNTFEYLQVKKNEAETTAYYSNAKRFGTGVDIWMKAVQTVSIFNPENYKAELRKIGNVSAIYENPADRNEVLVRLFTNDNYGD